MDKEEEEEDGGGMSEAEDDEEEGELHTGIRSLREGRLPSSVHTKRCWEEDDDGGLFEEPFHEGGFFPSISSVTGTQTKLPWENAKEDVDDHDE